MQLARSIFSVRPAAAKVSMLQESVDSKLAESFMKRLLSEPICKIVPQRRVMTQKYMSAESARWAIRENSRVRSGGQCSGQSSRSRADSRSQSSRSGNHSQTHPLLSRELAYTALLRSGETLLLFLEGEESTCLYDLFATGELGNTSRKYESLRSRRATGSGSVSACAAPGSSNN